MTTPTEGDARIDRILAAFARFDGQYKRAEVDAALALREEIAPRLLGVLEEAASDPSRFARDPDDFGTRYAAVLLAHFRDQRAHGPLADLAGLPEEQAERRLGGLITEGLSGLLYGTCGGDLERIKQVAANGGADDYARGAAAEALAFAVVDGAATREEVVGFLGDLLSEERLAEESPEFVTQLAGVICDLCPVESMSRIEAAYEEGLIASFFIGPDDFADALEQGIDACYEAVRRKLPERLPADVHDYMSWWACFEGPVSTPPQAPRPAQPPARFERQKAKAKRKRARKARRRQRHRRR